MQLASLGEHCWRSIRGCGMRIRANACRSGAREPLVAQGNGEEGKAGRSAEAALASRTAPTTATELALPERQDLPRERQTHQQHHKGEEGAQQDEKRHQTATGPRERRLTRR